MTALKLHLETLKGKIGIFVKSQSELLRSNSKGETLTQLICSVLLLILPAYIFFNLNRGIDFTDAGYYYVSLAHLADIRVNLVSFALPWNLLPIPDSIFWNRAFIFIGLGLSASFLMGSFMMFLHPSKKKSVLDILTYSALAIAAVSTFYSWWLPEPSYNSIALILNMTVTANVLRMVTAYKHYGRVTNTHAAATGLLVFALILTRPQTGVLMAAVLTISFIFLAKPKFKHLATIAGFSLLGMAALLILSMIFLEPLHVTIARIFAGFEHASILKGTSEQASFFAPFKQVKTDVLKIMDGNYLSVFALAVSIGLLNIKDKERDVLHSIGLILLLVALTSIAYPLWSEPNTLRAYSTGKAADYFVRIIIACLLAVPFLIFINYKKRFEGRLVIYLSILAIIIACLGSQVILTANNWVRFSGWFGVFPIMSLFILIRADRENKFAIKLIAISIFILTIHIGTYHSMTLRPYRLAAPLEKQTIPTQIRGGQSTLLTDDLTHDFLREISEAADQAVPFNERPHLIDLSGVLPFMNYHLNAKPTSWPWLLAGYDGSQNMFDTAVSHLTDEQLQQAWLIDAPEAPFSHSAEALTKRGFDLERGYKIIYEGPHPRGGAKIVLKVPIYQNTEAQK